LSLFFFHSNISFIFAVVNKWAGSQAEIVAPGKGTWKDAELCMPVIGGEGTLRTPEDSLENRNLFPLSL
jgi:hypothetical protein